MLLKTGRNHLVYLHETYQLMRLNQILFLLLSSIAFFSCKTQESALAPTLTILVEPGYTSKDTAGSIDSIVLFKVTATSNHNILKSIALFLSTNRGASAEVDRTVLSVNTATWETSQKLEGFVGDTLHYVISAIDDNGKSTSISVNINLRSILRDFKIDNIRQRIYNKFDTTRVAYNLSTGERLSFTNLSSVKDIVDLSSYTDSQVVFNKTWGSGHGTSQFIQVDAAFFSGASQTKSLEDEWLRLSSLATPTISNIAKGNYYLIKTRQKNISFDLYVIHITDILETTDDNSDYIEFSYKGG